MWEWIGVALSIFGLAYMALVGVYALNQVRLAISERLRRSDEDGLRLRNYSGVSPLYKATRRKIRKLAGWLLYATIWLAFVYAVGSNCRGY